MIYDTLLNLIKNNKNWKFLLESSPRFIKIKQCPYKNEDGNLKYPELYMLSYNGIFSDFNDEIVRLCRGCVVSIEDEANPKMVTTPFIKFGNYGESYCPDIDWDSAIVMDKVDGILIKLFNYKGNWVWITNDGWRINVKAKEIAQLPSKFKENDIDDDCSVKDLIDYSLKSVGFSRYEDLNSDYTYMFELLSTKLRILVDNKKTELVYLGSRNVKTYAETSLEEAYTINPILKNFRTVEYFDLKTIDEVLKLCSSYNGLEKEGVVIRDKFFNRVKIKCMDYIRLKWYRNSSTTTNEKIFRGILDKTIDDVLGVFPELNDRVNEIRKNIEIYRNKLISVVEEGKTQYSNILSEHQDLDEKELRKLYANWVMSKDHRFKFTYFQAIGKSVNYDEILNRMKYSDILLTLNNYDFTFSNEDDILRK